MGSPLPRRESWFRFFQFDEDKDKPGDVRNVLLVIATLIAAVTFQAGVNPPGGVWQENKNGNTAGSAIYAKDEEAYFVFLISNTLAFSTCILVITSLTYKFPFFLEIWIATCSMMVTFGSSLFAITPRKSSSFRYALIVAAVPFGLRFLIHLFRKCTSKISNPTGRGISF